MRSSLILSVLPLALSGVPAWGQIGPQPGSAPGGDRLEGGATQSDGRDARTTQNNHNTQDTRTTPPSDAHTLDFPNFANVPYVIESGPLDNNTDEYAVVFSHEVHLPGAAWLRLFYDRATLVGDSRVRVTSLLDGDVQELNAGILAQWSDTSAYFNGDRVLLELLAAPRTRGNELSLEKLRKQGRRPPDDDTQTTIICGSDDRVPTYDDWAGRLAGSEICSAAIFTTNSAMISAGHCIDPSSVMQFRVPPSFHNGQYCQIVHPPADEQFPVLPGWQSNANGIGDDWWVARVGQNGLGERPFDRYGQLRHVVMDDAPTGARTVAVGYGGEPSNCPDHATQQRSPGVIFSQTATYYQCNNDVTGGNSGSGHIFNNRIVGVVTHDASNCTLANFSTKASNADFVAARKAVAGTCITDLTGDGMTDQMDLARLLAAYNTIAGETGYDYVSDMDDDDLVGQSDLAALLAAYGSACR